MFRHEPADPRQDPTKIEEIAARLTGQNRGRGEFQNHQPGARAQHARRLPQAGVEVRQVADTEAHRGPVERRVGERQVQRVGRSRGCDPGGLAPSQLQHRKDEIGPDDPAGKPGCPASVAARSSVPAQRSRYMPPGARSQPRSPTAWPPPAAIHVEAEHMVEEIVTGGNRGEHAPDVAPLLGAAR